MDVVVVVSPVAVGSVGSDDPDVSDDSVGTVVGVGSGVGVMVGVGVGDTAVVAEGSGYDLHWDLKFDCVDAFKWSWEAEPKKWTWERGDFIYVPPFTLHQHFCDGAEEARLIVISNRIVKDMGFDWFDQIENALGY